MSSCGREGVKIPLLGSLRQLHVFETLMGNDPVGQIGQSSDPAVEGLVFEVFDASLFCSLFVVGRLEEALGFVESLEFFGHCFWVMMGCLDWFLCTVLMSL